jgi:hypothetical protein
VFCSVEPDPFSEVGVVAAGVEVGTAVVAAGVDTGVAVVAVGTAVVAAGVDTGVAVVATGTAVVGVGVTPVLPFCVYESAEPSVTPPCE